MLRPGLAAGNALWLIPCRAIHTVGMRFPIDVVLLDKSLKVVLLMENLPPFRLSKFHRSTHSVLELAAGAVEASSTRVGDQLVLTAAGNL